MILPPPAVLVRAVLVWLLIALAESAHGTARRLLLEPVVGDLTARQLSVFTGVALIFLLTWALIRWIRVQRTADLLAIGLGWVALTLVFEVALGRLLGLSWSRIASDYDLLHGGLMPLGLLAMALSPLVAARLRRQTASPANSAELSRPAAE